MVKIRRGHPRGFPWGAFVLRLLAALVLALATATVQGRDQLPNILILNSYHPGYVWSDDEERGLLSTLRQRYPHLVPRVEYLDTKNFRRLDHLELVKDYVTRKYQGEHFDLIVTLDNAALDFALNYRAQLFPGVPLVFAGVNGFRPEMLRGQKGITGVMEEQNLVDTVKLALRLHPQTRHLYVIQDFWGTGLQMEVDVATLRQAIPDLPPLTVAPNVPLVELEQHLKALSSDTLVLLLVYVPDRTTEFVSDEESSRRIPAASPVPVYAVHDTRLGHGVVGGFLLEGFEQGKQAGELALRILAGDDPDTLPVASSRSRPMFDDRQLRRFGLSAADLPSQSHVINLPTPWYLCYQQAIQISLITLVIAVIGALSLNVWQFRRHATQQRQLIQELQQSQATLAAQGHFNQCVLDSLDAHLAVINAAGVIEMINAAWRQFAQDNHGGNPRHWGIGANYFSACAENGEDAGLAATALTGIRAVQRRQSASFRLEYPCHSPDQPRWFILRAVPLNGDAGRVLIAHTDVTPLKIMQETLRQQAITDELTGVFNRRHFLELANEELKRATRLTYPLALALIDVDHFKRINDTHGHAAGDRALQAFVGICQNRIRDIDVLARFGGDEFIVLLPGTTARHAEEVMERVRQSLEPSSMEHPGDHWALTISVGIASRISATDTIETLIRRADQALYAAKARGRNQTCMEQVISVENG